jgi:hypothetical protein
MTGSLDFSPDTGGVNERPARDWPVERLCYHVAYYVLPHYVFERLEKVLELCEKSPAAAGPFFYVMACKMAGVEPDFEAARRFVWRGGEFGDGRWYLALEYPPPPPVDFGEEDPGSLLEKGIKLVLAPYLSVILYGDAAEADYYVLGQAPLGGGTTVRSVLKEGANCNLGAGPKPVLEDFLEAIRERQRRSGGRG